MDLVVAAVGAAVGSRVLETSWLSRGQLLLVLLATQYALVKIYRVFFYHRFFSPLRHVPGPVDNHFLFGQALKMAKAPSPNTLYLKWMHENPEAPFIRYLTFANSEILVVNSAQAHKEVLQSQCYSFKKPDRWLRMTKDIGWPGIIMLEGDEHRMHRKMLNGAFSPENVRRLGPVFQRKACEVGLFFDAAISGQKTGTIDCVDTFTKAMMDIIGVAIFGVDLANIQPTDSDEASGEGSKYNFHKIYEQIFAMDDVGKLFMFGSGFLPMRWIPCRANRSFKFASAWLRATLHDLVRSRRHDINQSVTSGDHKRGQSVDMLSFMIEESLPGGAAEGMTDEYIVGHLLILLAGGHETSANMLCWSTYILATRHDVQDKLRAEITELAAKKEQPTCADIDSLPYMSNFVRESMRVYPPSVYAPRQTAKDVVIQGVAIPKGTVLDMVPVLSSTNPLVWGGDAQEVDPDRWDRLSAAQASPYAYEVFSNGPRICIGKQFSMYEIKAVLYEMVKGYRFLGVEGEFTVENPALTLRPANMRIRLEKV